MARPKTPVNEEPQSRGDKIPILRLELAENLLLRPELENLLAEPPLVMEEADFGYPTDTIGDAAARGALATLLSDLWGLAPDRRLCADNILYAPGATAALHLHALARLKEGDSILVPRPYWAMFDYIYQRSGIAITEAPMVAESGSSICLASLRDLYQERASSGSTPSMLLLTNPHNPLGLVEKRSTLESVLKWALEETRMDVVADEIYANTVHDSEASFVSVLALEHAIEYPERVHSVWGCAKDFGLSGWLLGALLTRSTELVKEISWSYSRFAPFDALKSRVMRRLLCERQGETSAHRLLSLLPSRLAAARSAVTAVLEEEGIAYGKQAQGGLFLWLDLRSYLDSEFAGCSPADTTLASSKEDKGLDSREGLLLDHLASHARVLLLQGQEMHCQEPGFYRLCFTAAPTNEVVSAVRRMGAALRSLSCGVE